jgi:uncharacterized membrane protein YphA (DoxX/SURF4 family)
VDSFDLTAPLLLAARIVVACIFLTAGAGKLRHLTVFEGVLANYRLLPRWAIAPMHVLLPLAELAIGVGVVAVPQLAAPAAALLLLVFAAAMAVNLRRGRNDIDCGCHQSVLRQRLSWTLVWRNGALTVLALAAALPAPRLAASAWLTGAGAGLGVFALYCAMNSLWAVGPVSRRRIRIAGVPT